MEIKIAGCFGMCGGVKRALQILNDALEACSGENLYVYHDIVHNSFVINELKKKGVIFANSVDEIPRGAVTVFSAHGVSCKIEDEARAKELRIFDASCLLVKKNHAAVEKAAEAGCRIIFIGSREHPECIGTIGRAPDGYCFTVENEDDIKKLPDIDGDIISVSQTTMAVNDTAVIQDALRCKYPQIRHLDGICFATTERQEAVRKLALDCDLILIAGSKRSANSCRLRQIAAECGVFAELVDDLEDLKDIDFSKFRCVGISAGASTPQEKVDELVDFIRRK